MRRTTLFLALLALSTPAWTQDVIVSEIGLYFGGDDYQTWGPANGYMAYSWATTACNLGDQEVRWTGNDDDAPILSTNAFRIHEGRIEHMGYSFVKYGGCANSDPEPNCSSGNCTPTGGCDLGVGCTDVYWATLNDGKFGGAKWEVDPLSAVWAPGPPTGPIGNTNIRGRVQIDLNDLAAPGAVFIAEGQYLAADDHAAGNAENDFGWREVGIGVGSQMFSAGPSVGGQPGIFAWQAYERGVQISAAPVIDEGGPGQHGWIWVGSRAIDEGGGQWRYEYAVQNGNSARGVGTFAVEVPCDGTFVLGDDHYRGVRHHSGSPYGNGNWVFQTPTGLARWKTTDHTVNPNSSALRWGELASFGFTCNRPPADGNATLGLFTPGSPDSVTAAVVVPAGLFRPYCSATNNSTGVPATIAVEGSPHVSHEDLVLSAGSLPLNKPGFFLMSETQGFQTGFGGGQGNLCLGTPILRFGKWVQSSRGTGTVEQPLDFGDLPQGTVFQPGDTWNFQYWYRDKNPSSTSNTTKGVKVSFCP